MFSLLLNRSLARQYVIQEIYLDTLHNKCMCWFLFQIKCLNQIFLETNTWFQIKLIIHIILPDKFFHNIANYCTAYTYSNYDGDILLLIVASEHLTQPNSQVLCLKVLSSCTDQAVSSCNRCNIKIRANLVKPYSLVFPSISNLLT